MSISNEVRDYIENLAASRINQMMNDLRKKHQAKADKAWEKWEKSPKGKKLIALKEKHSQIQAQIKQLTKEGENIRQEISEVLGEPGEYHITYVNYFEDTFRSRITNIKREVRDGVLPEEEVKRLADLRTNLKTKIMLAMNKTAIENAIKAINESLGLNIEI